MSTLSVANIHFESTANNRVQYVGSNTITISTAGTERVRIDGVGNTTFSNTVNVTGAASFSNTVNVTGAATFSNTVTINTGSGQFTSALTIQASTHATSRRAAIYIGSWLLDQDTGGDGTKDFGIYDSVASSTRLSIATNGNISAANSFTAAGNVTAYSDIKLKTNITTIDNALDKVLKMRGVMFNRKDTGARSTGVIAQEIQEILPEVVQEGETLSVAYGNIVGVLIEAIKELKAEIEQLKGK